MKHTYFPGVAFFAAMLLGACGDGLPHGADGHAAGEAHGHAHALDEIPFSAAQARAAGLRVERVEPSDFSEVLVVSGRILPAAGAEATVTATMAGMVEYAVPKLTDGVAVRAGQPLFTINARAMANGNPAAAAQAELSAARQSLARAEKLAQEKIISRQELETARQRYETAAATAQSLGSAAQTRSIPAPLGGYVKSLSVKPGDYVDAGQPLATVTQNRRVQLRADVPERFFDHLPQIVSANFRPAYGEAGRTYAVEELGGRLLSRGRAVDADGYAVPVIFELDNVGGIVPGSMAEVWLKGTVRHGVISVPTSALTEAQGLFFVYVQTHADAYRRQEVSVGATDGRRTEITAGLKAGDRVVTQGAVQVRLAASADAAPEGHSH